MNANQQPIDIHRKVAEFIDSGEPFAVGLILSADGSTPQKAGCKAIIDGAGRIYGTLGGGQVEAQAQSYAVEACKSRSPVVFDICLEGADRADDMPICGGQMRIVIDPTADKDGPSYAEAAEVLLNRKQGVLLTTVTTAEQTEVNVQWFSRDAFFSEASFPGSEAIRSTLAGEEPKLFTQKSQEPEMLTEVMVEPVIPRPHLVIAGGGHIGQALALQGSILGFDVTVIDDRAEFTSPDLFPEGTRTRCGDVAKELLGCDIAGDTYIVIVTRGHKHDAEALEACIHLPAAYIGMIGSRRKVALIRENFIESDLASEEEFDRVFTPIGLDIGAATVPEIATSIAAELVSIRRKGSGDSLRDKGPAL